jgi:hypothetical protein
VQGRVVRAAIGRDMLIHRVVILWAGKWWRRGRTLAVGLSLQDL